jgi:tetratricopeptide (TPR) repeat protein
MTVQDIPLLRLDLARALSAEGRCEDALGELRAGLAESQAPDVVVEFRCLAAEVLQKNSQPGAALGEWLEAVALGTEKKTPYAAMAALRLLERASGQKILSQLGRETIGRFDKTTADGGAPLAGRLLRLRLHRLREDGGGLEDLARELISSNELDAETRSMLAIDLAALGLTEDALKILPDDEAPRTVAVRARLLVEAGDYATVKSVALPADPKACRSVLVSQALVHLAEGEHDAAAACVARCPPGEDAEPHLVSVLLALAQNDYDGAKSALNTAATLTADGLDARLLRAQIRLERGETDDIRRGRQLLERLAGPTESGTAREPEWMRLQRAVRSDDERFMFVFTEWAFLRGAPETVDLLSNAAHLRTTYPQDAGMAAHLADLLARRGDTQAAADALDDSVKAWLNVNAYPEASEAATKARGLDEARGRAALSRVFASEARASLSDDADRDVVSALGKAEQAWQLQQDENAATLWAEAALAASYEQSDDGEPRFGDDPLVSALHAVATPPVTAVTAGYRGLLHFRLSQVASTARVARARAAVAWLMVSVLLDTEQRIWWENLAWALGQLDACTCALEVAKGQVRLAEKEPEALWVLLATTLNQYGTPESIAPILRQFHDNDGRPPDDWANALASAQIQAASLTGKLDQLPGLMNEPLPDDVLWSVATRAEALAQIEGPQWRDVLRAAAVGEAKALDHLSAAQHRLILGEFDETIRQCDLAQATGTDEASVDVVRQFVRLMKGRAPSAERHIADYLEHLACPAQLLSYVNIDLLLLSRAAGPGRSPVFSRLRGLALARLEALETVPAADPESELREADKSGVLEALFRLFILQGDAQVPWSFHRHAVDDLAGTLASPGRAAGPDEWSPQALTSAVDQIAEVVLGRAARLCLAQVRLLPETGDPRETLAEATEWMAALADPRDRREAMAIHALLVAIADGTSLAQAVSSTGASGLDEDLSPQQLADVWRGHVPDAGSWWRLCDTLASTLPREELAAVEPTLLGRLSQLCGLTEPEQATDRAPQGVLLGRSLVPDDSSSDWIIFTQFVPALKQRLEERTGCRIPGFRMRFDPVLDDAVTHLLNGVVTEFVRLPPEAHVRTSPRPDGSSDEFGPGQVAKSAEVVTSHLEEWVARHLDRFYSMYDVLYLASTAQVRLANPTELVFWLDAIRGAIAAHCRLPDGDHLAALVHEGRDKALSAEQTTEMLRSALPSWSDPVEESQP